MIAAFVVAAKLHLLISAVASSCNIESCVVESDATSLLQTMQVVSPGIEKPHRLLHQEHKEPEAKIMPRIAGGTNSDVTFVGTVGGSKWYFWFRRALNKAREKEAEAMEDEAEAKAYQDASIEAEAATRNYLNYQDPIYAGVHAPINTGDGLVDNPLPWSWYAADDYWGLPWKWRMLRREPWNDVIGKAIYNGRRWAQVGKALRRDEMEGWPNTPMSHDDYEVAAALPVDPLEALELNPTPEEVAQVEASIELAMKGNSTKTQQRAKSGAEEDKASGLDDAI